MVRHRSEKAAQSEARVKDALKYLRNPLPVMVLQRPLAHPSREKSRPSSYRKGLGLPFSQALSLHENRIISFY